MRRAQRTRVQLPHCYYEGFLEKRSFKDKIGRRLWAALCGDSLFFYNNSKDSDYVEKQDLSHFLSLTDDPSLDRRLGSARLHLRLEDDDIYLTAPSLEARELWKGFILSVVKLVVPTSLNLLPGQIQMLKEAVEKENERIKYITAKSAPAQASAKEATTVPDNYLPVLPDMPACFHRVSREDAEIILEKHKEKGNLLLRPSRDGTSYAVTTRQDFNKPVFRHYRVTRIPDGGFDIAVDKPIYCTTLHDVISYLLENTSGAFKPFILEHTYEETLVYVEDNLENGEKTFRSPVAPKLPPKPVKTLVHQTSIPELQKGPAPRKKLSCPKESIYLNPSDEDEDHVDACIPPPVLPRNPVVTLVHQTSIPELQKGPGGALLPPTTRLCSAAVTPEAKPRQSVPPVPAAESLSQSLHEELTRAVQLRAVHSDL